MSVYSLLNDLQTEISSSLFQTYQLGWDECAASRDELLKRLITCADNGYDTAELHDIVSDARKAARR